MHAPEPTTAGTNDRPTPTRDAYDAIIVGSGPNGLAAAITLARQGWSVLVVEGKQTVGGGMRSAELTQPGFVHDLCSAIHPMGVASPFFRSLALTDHGLQWVQPDAPLAHPLPDGSAAVLHQSLDATCDGLGADGRAYRKLMAPLVAKGQPLIDELLAPLHWPRHPLLMARFGLRAIRSATGLARGWFRTDAARALFAGNAGHSIVALENTATAAFGLVLMLAGHVVGWPFARGGSQNIALALTAYLKSLGGEIVTDFPVASLDQLPPSKAILFDTTPRHMADIAGDALPARYARKLRRFRHGPGVFKVDWALDGPIPWRAEACAGAATVHVGGTLEEIALSERDAWHGRVPENPFVLLAQHTPFDPTRAPAGKHTAWGYCHVPNGCDVDMTQRIEMQIERFAPGFRDRIIARHTIAASGLENYNANYLGGDIAGGANDVWQLFTRPVARLCPYATPNRRLYLCSASTPPGGGVHGMCGYHAAQAVLRRFK